MVAVRCWQKRNGKIGILALHSRHSFVEDVVPKAMRGHNHIDAHAVLRFGGHGAAFLLDLIVVFEKLGRGGYEVLAFWSGLHGGAVEQPHPKRCFEIGDMAREARLG